jgi:formylglycine-generating enzyme required for sulfatase activity
MRKRVPLTLISLSTLAVLFFVGRSFLGPYLEKREFDRIFESLGRNDQGYEEFRHRETGTVFVSLPGGDVQFGRELASFWGFRVRESSPGEVMTLNPFMIAKYEITVKQWRDVIGGSHESPDDLPVAGTKWHECQRYCERVGLRLPTEAQWEYACKAGSDYPFNVVGKFEDSVWYEPNSGGAIQPFGKKTPNKFGIHDMHANVQEWCRDRADSGDGQLEISDSLGVPMSGDGESIEGAHMIRGGSFHFGRSSCVATYRTMVHPDIYSAGLRPVGSKTQESTTENER